jgi:hypothetical protein
VNNKNRIFIINLKTHIYMMNLLHKSLGFRDVEIKLKSFIIKIGNCSRNLTEVI